MTITYGAGKSRGRAIRTDRVEGAGTRVDARPARGGASTAGEAHGSDSARLHVLLVDDDPALARLETRQLESAGYQVTVRHSSVEALSTFRGRPGVFDLLVTDNSMPKMTGLELVRHVRAIRQDIPVVLVSGVVATEDSEALLAAGVTELLAKPYHRRDLTAAVDRAVGKQGGTLVPRTPRAGPQNKRHPVDGACLRD